MESIENDTTKICKLSESELQQIREIRIHKILGVQDNGRRISMKCPFHQERTPSFTLYPENNFYCFGCNVSGRGAIDFCTKLGYSFQDSLKELVKYL